jgi:hypothetical protein
MYDNKLSVTSVFIRCTETHPSQSHRTGCPVYPNTTRLRIFRVDIGDVETRIAKAKLR